jgi:hypothetical protein
LLCSLVVVVFMLALVWSRRSLHVDLRRLGFGAGAAFVALLPVALAPLIAPTSRIGLQQTSKDELFGATLRDFFVPSTRHAIYGHEVKNLVGLHVGESVIFFGYGTMALACIAVAMLLRRRLPFSLPLRFALLAVPFGVLAALPAHESILGVRIAMPDPAELIGGLVSWWRVYERFGAVAGFGLVLLASVAIDRLIRSGRRAYVAAAGVGVALMFLEALPGLPVPVFRIGADPATTWLRAHPGGTVATYPIVPDWFGDPTWENLHWSSYYLQVYHHHPVFNAPLGAPRPTVSAIAATLVSDLSNEETPAILRGEGVRWVVLHQDVYQAMGESAPRLARGFAVVARFPGAQVLRVTAPPTNLRALVRERAGELAHRIAVGDAVIEFGNGFYAAENYGTYTGAHWLRQNGKLLVHTGGEPLPYIVYELRIRAFSAKGPRVVKIFEDSRQVGSFEVPAYEIVVHRRLRFPGIYSTLTFTATPGPHLLSAPDRRDASVLFESVRLVPVGLRLDREQR